MLYIITGCNELWNAGAEQRLQCYLDMFAEYDDMLYVKDVSKMLKTCEKRVRRMFHSGEIKSFLYGRYHCTS